MAPGRGGARLNPYNRPPYSNQARNDVSNVGYIRPANSAMPTTLSKTPFPAKTPLLEELRLLKAKQFAPPQSVFEGQSSSSRLSFETAPSMKGGIPSSFAPEILKVQTTRFPPSISPSSSSDHSFPSTSSPIQKACTISDQVEALRESHNGITSKAPTRLDLMKAVKSGSFDQSLISGIRNMTCTQIKNTLLCGGIDLIKIASMLEDHSGDIDVKRAIETSLTMKRLEIMESMAPSQHDLPSLSLSHVKGLDSISEGFIITINDGLFCDLQKVLTLCYRILGKTDHRKFLRGYLKQVLFQILLPHQRSVVYLEKLHKKNNGAFIFPAEAVHSMRKISRRLFNVHTLPDEDQEENRQFKRMSHDAIFKELLGKAMETFRQGKIRNLEWLSNCVFNDRDEYVQEEEHIVYVNEEGRDRDQLDFPSTVEEIREEIEVS